MNQWAPTPSAGIHQVSVWGGYATVDLLCELYRLDPDPTTKDGWYNDAQGILSFLLSQARDTAGYFPNTTSADGYWDVVRNTHGADSNITLITQAAAASAILQFATLIPPATH